MGDRIVVLDAGKVQQVAPPLELYARPANLFVAGFIGSPAMNFIPGTIARGAAGTRFHSNEGGVEIPLGGSAAPTLEASAGRTLTLGVRPEDVAVARPGDPSRPSTTMTLDVVEPMGNEIILSARTGALEVTARVGPQSLPEPGTPIAISFDATRLHWFDGSTGARIDTAG